MQVICSCGCALDIQSIDLDCMHDMTVYVTSCEDCDADAGERHDKQETRADDLEYEVDTLKEEIVELKAAIEETKYPIRGPEAPLRREAEHPHGCMGPLESAACWTSPNGPRPVKGSDGEIVTFPLTIEKERTL